MSIFVLLTLTGFDALLQSRMKLLWWKLTISIQFMMLLELRVFFLHANAESNETFMVIWSINYARKHLRMKSCNRFFSKCSESNEAILVFMWSFFPRIYNTNSIKVTKRFSLSADVKWVVDWIWHCSTT